MMTTKIKFTAFVIAMVATLTLTGCSNGDTSASEQVNTPTATETTPEPTEDSTAETPAPTVTFAMSDGTVVEFATTDPAPEAVIADIGATALANIPSVQGNEPVLTGVHNKAVADYATTVGDQLGRKIIVVESQYGQRVGASVQSNSWRVDLNAYDTRAEAMDVANKQAAVNVFYVVVPLDYVF